MITFICPMSLFLECRHSFSFLNLCTRLPRHVLFVSMEGDSVSSLLGELSSSEGEESPESDGSCLGICFLPWGLRDGLLERLLLRLLPRRLLSLWLSLPLTGRLGPGVTLFSWSELSDQGYPAYPACLSHWYIRSTSSAKVIFAHTI